MSDQPPDLPIPPIGSGAAPPPDGWAPPAGPGPVAPPPTGGWTPPAVGTTGAVPPPSGALPPYPPIGSTVPSISDGTVVGHRVNRGLLVAALAVVVVGAGFALLSLTGGGGSSSPEAAVDDLLSSLSDEDVIGMLETVRPAEREALQGPLEDTISEMERLDLLAAVDLTDFQGVDVELEGYQLLTTELHDGVVAVTVSGGTVTGAATPQDLPLGDTLRDILEEDLEVELQESTESETTDIGEFQLVAVSDGGSWYVSPGYSIAEAARQASEAPLPPFDDSVVPVGGESPEASVQALAAAAVDLDAEAAITQLDPEEMAALYDYAPLFLDDAAEASEDAMDSTEVSFELTDLVTEDGPGDTQRVLVRGFEISAETHDEYEDSSYSMTYDGECFEYEESYTYTYDYAYGDDDSEVDDEGYDDTETSSGEWCADEPFVVDEDTEMYYSGLPTLGAPFGELSLLTVERDGRWYVAPTRSLLELIPAALRGVESSDIDSMREWLEQFWGTSYEMEFEEVGEAIDLCEDGYDEDGFCEVGPSMTYEPSPIDDCYGDFEDTAFADDPVHADIDPYGDRAYYLSDTAYQDCLADLVASGEISEADSYVWDDPCWSAYQALGPEATAADWEAADDEVAACYSDQFGDPEEPDETVDPLDGPIEIDPDDPASIRDQLIEGFAEGGFDETTAACIADGLLAELGEDVVIEQLGEGAEFTSPEELELMDIFAELMPDCMLPSELQPTSTVAGNA